MDIDACLMMIYKTFKYPRVYQVTVGEIEDEPVLHSQSAEDELVAILEQKLKEDKDAE
jgi:hypothetical protein